MRAGKKRFAAEVGSVTEQTFKYTKEQGSITYARPRAGAQWTTRQVIPSGTKAMG